MRALARLVALTASFAAAEGTAAAPSERPSVAVFDIVLVDSSLEGEVSGADAREAARLNLLDGDLRARLEDSGRLEVIIAEQKSDRGCRACSIAAAAALGAEFALTGWVQKVSDLILNINLRVTEVDGGAVVFQDSVDIRGNTDESWLRGLRNLVKYRLLAAPG